MLIVRSTPDEAAALTAIAFAAKRHWGYPESWIRAWSDVLTITPEFVENNPTHAVAIDGKMMGFYGLCLPASEAVLEHLWVLPAAMGTGIGRALFGHAEQIAREAGVRRLTVTSDPNAEGFYRRMGATTFAREPAHIEGHERFLPRMEKILV